MTVIETLFYCANEELFLKQYLDIKDCGGTIAIHMFGAYFGLAVSWVLGQPTRNEKEANSSVSDMFSLVGTVFLWLYWPSFVAGPLESGTLEAETAISNTILSLLGSTLTTFI